ncbi:hypothetical protein [Stutzerimonas kirkiae]|uniref:hypothetical protein n=1 Tax=Stutzerimonas kirkiae TaxID=2211392 RepID=UPI00103835E7|nr:hypothetical protein [Stutzerimonas kirkiae]
MSAASLVGLVVSHVVSQTDGAVVVVNTGEYIAQSSTVATSMAQFRESTAFVTLSFVKFFKSNFFDAVASFLSVCVGGNKNEALSGSGKWEGVCISCGILEDKFVSFFSLCLFAARLTCVLWMCLSLSVEAGDHEMVEFYSDVRKDVRVSELADNKEIFSKSRPEGFFQGAGSINPVVCKETLDSLNGPGFYTGENIANWLSSGRVEIEFSSLPGSKKLPDLWGGRGELEYVSVDVNGDGRNEYIYKRTGIIRGKIYQRIMVVDHPLHLRTEMLRPYMDACKKWGASDSDCDDGVSLISFLMNEPHSRRPTEEWGFTKNNPISYFTGNKNSLALIFPGGGNMAKRNLGTSSGVNWTLYKIDSGVVLISVPTSVFAPPELLVFSLGNRGSGKLQCVFMPLSW